MLPCLSISQITIQTDSTGFIREYGKLIHPDIKLQWMPKRDLSAYPSVTLNPEQVFNVYVGLKLSEEYKGRYNDCLSVANQLTKIIDEQDVAINKAMADLEFLNLKIAVKQDELTEKAVAIEKMKSAKTKWFKSPWLWASVGLVAGILITK